MNVAKFFKQIYQREAAIKKKSKFLQKLIYCMQNLLSLTTPFLSLIILIYNCLMADAYCEI